MTRADSDREWSKKVSDLQQQLQDAEASYDAYRADWCRQVDEYRGKLRMATDEVACLQRQLAEGAQFAPVRDPDELQSLRRTVEELSVTLGEGKAELQQLKIQLVYEQQAVKDAEVESEVLRKRC